MSTRQGGHGGPRTPAKPAPVSGPGALSARTDGGPGGKQPVREIPGGRYGEAKAFREQQQGAPMAAGESRPAVPQGPPTTVEGRAPTDAGLFGPTTRPGEDIGTGSPYPSPVQGFPQEDPMSADDILRAMYAARPSPWLLRLIRD